MQAIVVTFDRLATRLVGCYGNEWIETPNFDRLATTSTVFDNHFTDSVGPLGGKAWLTGRHALRPAADSAQIGRLLSAAGVATHVFVEESSRSIPLHGSGFNQVVRVAGRDGLDAAPADVPFARLVQASSAKVRETSLQSDKRLIWLHAPEPGLPPEGFAALYFEDFEERGMSLADMPRELWSQQLAVAAGSMSLVDHWLGELISRVRAMGQGAPTLLVIAAARGRSWMDDFLSASVVRAHSPADLLRDQEARTPLLVSVIGDDRFVDLSGIRCGRFVQPMDLYATLLNWFGVEFENLQLEGRSLVREPVSDLADRNAVFFGDDDRSLGVRTASWGCLMRLAEAGLPTRDRIQFGDKGWPEVIQLFSKPEDVWDVTDVATQWPTVCEQLLEWANQYRTGKQPDFSSLETVV